MKTYTVLHTIESGGPGGAETVVLNLATRLDPKRFRSIVLLPEGPWLNPRLKACGIPVIEVSWRSWWDLRGPWAMIRAVRDNKVDLIHSHLPGQNFYSCIVGCLTRTKTVVTYHGPVELEWSRNVKGRIRLWFVRTVADRVIVVCNMVKQLLIGLGFQAGRISLVYNGIERAEVSQPSPRSILEELDLGKTHKLVGMVANVRQSKGYEFYIKACAEVCRGDHNVTFLAIGDLNEELAAPIKALHAQLSLGERFRFLGFRSDVARIVSELDIFVLASTSEGMPLSILEAMAAGRPIVATHCGGIPEMIDHGYSGWLVPPGDSHALAKAIARMLTDEALSERLGRQARSRFAGQFTLAGMIQRYENLYGCVLDGRDSSR